MRLTYACCPRPMKFPASRRPIVSWDTLSVIGSNLSWWGKAGREHKTNLLTVPRIQFPIYRRVTDLASAMNSSERAAGIYHCIKR